jgi:LacI family transcriptional regulator
MNNDIDNSAMNGNESSPNTSLGDSRKRPNLAAMVAEQVGVSLMTVSRVFTNSASVRESTRRKVLKVAAELGYHPNQAARALRTGRFDTVGFLLPIPQGLAGEFHSQAFSAFEQELSMRGIAVLLTIASGPGTLCSRVRDLVNAKRCAVVVVRFDMITPEELQELRSIGAPVVLANYVSRAVSDTLDLNSVGFDGREGIQMAVRHLASLGHHRVAHLRGTPGWIDTVNRDEGFRTGMAEVGLQIDEHFVRDCDFGQGFDSGVDATNQILSQRIKGPTAIICDSDMIAAGAMVAARRWGKSIPKDISIVGFDANQWCAWMSPPLTSVSHSGDELGDRLGQLVMSLFDNPDQPPQRIVLETRLVVRESTGPAPNGD